METLQQSFAAEIIPYDSQYYSFFRELNIQWLEQYGLLEDHDIMVLNDPQATILDKGGAIYLAIADKKIVGSSVLIKAGDDHFELAKMAVSESYRGKGISKLLIEKCIDTAMERGAKKISLFSNHQLTTAIALYRKYGFKDVVVEDSPFQTADVKMERIF
jgi:putative acetyltransferase